MAARSRLLCQCAHKLDALNIPMEILMPAKAANYLSHAVIAVALVASSAIMARADDPGDIVRVKSA
jgi:hypothetical protein